MRNVALVVPGDCATLAAAVRVATAGQRVLLRAGDHLVSSLKADDPGSSQLRVDSELNVRGEPGSVLRGTLVLGGKGRGGSISGLRLEDGGDCCIRCEGGRWTLEDLELCCSHSASVHASAGAELDLSGCTLGGVRR